MAYTIWTTSQCNLNCTYCYENHGKQKHNGDFDDDIIKFLSKANKQELNHISFHGGEPLLGYNIIKKVSDYCRNNFLDTRFSFTTNGTQWNDEIEKILMENYEAFRYGISLSIDGTQQSHDLSRKDMSGKGTYNQVIYVKDKLIKLFPDVCARMTIVPENVMYMYEGIKSLGEMGFKVISTIVDLFSPNWNDTSMKIFVEEYEKIIEFWMGHKYLQLSLIDSLIHRKPCGSCNLSYHIYVDGNIYPCTYVTGNEQFKIGDLEHGVEIEKCKKIIMHYSGDYKLCENCANVRYCSYNRCKLINISINGTNDMPSVVGCCLENIIYDLRVKYREIIQTYL